MRTRIPMVSITEIKAIIVLHTKVYLSFAFPILARTERSAQAMINGKGTYFPGTGMHLSAFTLSL